MAETTRAEFLRTAALTAGLLAVGSGVAPKRADALVRRRTGHPRVIADSQKFAEIKGVIAASTRLKKNFDRLKNLAKTEILPSPLVKYRTTSSGGGHKTARDLVDRLFTLSLLYKLDASNKEVFANRAIREMLNAAKYPHWRPQSALDLGEITTAMAVGYDWCFDKMTRAQRRKIRGAILRLGIKDYMSTPNTNWRGNWNQVIHSGIGIGCMAIKGDTRRDGLVAKARNRVEKNLPTGLEKYSPSGGTEEGVNYWSYGWQYLTYFFQTTLVAEGAYSPLVNKKGLRYSGYFPMYCTDPTDKMWRFADNGKSDLERAMTNWAMWHGQKYDDDVLRWFGNQGHKIEPNCTGKDHAASLLCHTSAGTPPVKRDRSFGKVGLTTFRSAWQNRNALFVGFKWGGRAAGGHTHLDRGSFIITALGHQWSEDIGPDSYSLPGYSDFDSQRWKYYRCRAEGHNTLVINPSGRIREDQKPLAAPIHDKQSLNSASPFLITDLSPVYKIRKVKRGVKLLDREKVIVQDEISSYKRAVVWWFMHTRARISLSRDRKSATLSYGDGKRLWLKIQNPSAATFIVRDAAPLPSSPDPASQKNNSGIRKLSIKLKKVRKARITVVAVPLDAGQRVPTSLPPVTPLAKW